MDTIPDQLGLVVNNLKKQTQELMDESARLIDGGELCDDHKFKDKLEAFLGSCFMAEQNLVTIRECVKQGRASNNILATKPPVQSQEPVDPSHSYTEFLNSFKFQVESSATINSMLSDYVSQTKKR